MPRTSNDPLIKDYEDLAKLVEGNNVAGLRAAQKFIPRQLYALQKRLAKYRNNETLLLQRIRRDLDLSQIEGERADHFQKIKAMQEFDYYDSGFPDPHQRINYDRNKLLNLTTGIQDQISELDRYGHYIKSLQAKVKKLKEIQGKVNTALAAAGEIKQKDVEADKIAEREVYSVMLLYQIHEEFRVNTLNDKGERRYTQDPKTVKLLEELQLRFTAFAERNPWVLSGEITLNLLDPGAEENWRTLIGLLGKLRKITKLNKVETEVRKYVSSLTRNLNDNFISENIRRRQVSTNKPEEGNALAPQTRTIGRFLNFTNDVNWWMSPNSYTFIEAVENAFKYRVSALYNGRPICGREAFVTQEETDRKAAIEEEEAQEALGQEEFEKKKANSGQ